LTNKIKKLKKTEEQNKFLINELKNFKHPSKFKLPLNPKIETKSIIINNCKVLKNLTLWIEFEKFF
jgi:hypothetical protein